MTSRLRLGLLAGSAAALLAWNLLAERDPPEDPVPREALLLGCDPEDVTLLLVERATGRARARRGDAGFVVETTSSRDDAVVPGGPSWRPAPDAWAPSAASRAVEAACTLPVLDRVPLSAGADAFGLADPTLVVVLDVDGERRLEVGSPTPAGTALYVRLDGGSEAIVVGTWLRAALDELLARSAPTHPATSRADDHSRGAGQRGRTQPSIARRSPEGSR